uniref:Phytocyanin domain-containing protein n=1 Tax=Arundo donax TaxID=35708 RepID=A0A0A9DVZ6_ARUDO
MGRGEVAAAVLLALAAWAAVAATTTANKISINWKPNVNYSDWEAQHRPFYKGDWLGTFFIHCQPLDIDPQI